MDRAWLPVALLASLTAVGLALQFGLAAERAPVPLGREPDAADPAAEPTTASAQAGATPQRLAAAADTAPPGRNAAPPDAQARLLATVSDARGRGLAARLCFLTGPNRGRDLESDDGTFDVAGLYPGLALLQIRIAEGTPCERLLTLRAHATTDLCVTCTPGPMHHGTVVDESGTAIADATVTLDGTATATDATGAFAVRPTGTGATLLTVRARGFVALCRELAATPVDPALRLVLHPAGALRIQLPTLGLSADAVDLYLLPAAAGPRDPRNGRSTFPWHLVSPIATRDGEVVLVDELPAMPIDVVAVHAVAAPITRRVQVVAGAEQRLVLPLRPALAAAAAQPGDRGWLRATFAALGDGRGLAATTPWWTHPGDPARRRPGTRG